MNIYSYDGLCVLSSPPFDEPGVPGPRALSPQVRHACPRRVGGYHRIMAESIEVLRAFFAQRADISFALLFGSRACGRAGEDLYGRYTRAATLLAEDERCFAESFLRIKARSRSLSEIDRDRSRESSISSSTVRPCFRA